MKKLAQSLDPATREALAARLRFYRDLGLTEFYRRPVDPALAAQFANAPAFDSEAPPTLGAPGLASETGDTISQSAKPQEDQPIPPRKAIPAPPQVAAEVPAAGRAAALQLIRDEIGD